MPDHDVSHGDRRIQALARVRTILLDLGCTEEEIDRAVDEDVVDLLMVDEFQAQL